MPVAAILAAAFAMWASHRVRLPLWAGALGCIPAIAVAASAERTPAGGDRVASAPNAEAVVPAGADGP